MVLTIKNFESQNVGPGVTETAPTNLVGVAGTLKATLTWTSATGESGVIWSEEKLVRKEGSAPSNSLDGTTVTTITTKDTYATNGYEDTGLDSTKTYYYKVFAIYDNGTERGTTAVSVTPTASTLLSYEEIIAMPFSTVQSELNAHPTEYYNKLNSEGHIGTAGKPYPYISNPSGTAPYGWSDGSDLLGLYWIEGVFSWDYA